VSGRISKELRPLLKQVLAQGGETRVTRRGHTQILREGRVVATLPGSTGDRKAYLACRSDLRRAGFAVD
jgi:hypothetical protein